MTSASLLSCVEIEPDAPASHSVIWLHGLGADGNDFVPLLPYLQQAGLPPTRFVFPHAPQMPVTLNGGMVMRAWFDLAMKNTGEFTYDEEGVRRSAEQVTALVERERDRGVAPGRIVIAGFSQGGAIALHLGTRMAEPFAGIIALSCDLPVPEKLAAEKAPAAVESTPIFLAHGVADPLVVFQRGERTRERLLAEGCSVDWHEYPMQHEVCGEEIADIAGWLSRILGAS